jgi:hypothetical protein
MPEELLPQVLEVVERLSQQSRRRTHARAGKPLGQKKRPGRLKLPADREAAEAFLREEVGFGMLPASLELVRQVMEEDLYDLE